MSKTLEELREEKKILEENIKDLLNSFAKSTGIAVKEIGVEFYKITDQGTGQVTMGIIGVIVKLEEL